MRFFLQSGIIRRASSQTTSFSRRGVAALAFGHGANDMYMGFLPALLPAIIGYLGLDYKGAGLLISTVTLTSQLSQPALGFAGDRINRRVFAIIAPMLTALFLSGLGFVHNYRSLVLLLIVGSMASSAFHPHGAALVNAVARQRVSTAMAYFTSGGSLGYGLGSVLAAVIVTHWGFTHIWLGLPIGFLAALLLAVAVPRSVESQERQQRECIALSPKRWFFPLTVLFIVVMLRAATATMFTTFVPILLERRGESLLLGGWALFGFSLAGAVGGLFGGRWSETMGPRAVTVASFLFTAPAFFLFLHTGGILAGALLMLTGACLFSALPVNIVLGQELAPRHASTVSGLIMGFAWGIGGLGATLLGAFADHLSVIMGEAAGLARAMDLIPIVPLSAAALAMMLPKQSRVIAGEIKE